MSTRVVVNLSVDVYRRAECVALMTNCDVADVVADAAGRYLEMMSRLVHDPRPAAELSDAEVLALSESYLEPRVDQRLSALLERQRESEITADERSELADLMRSCTRRARCARHRSSRRPWDEACARGSMRKPARSPEIPPCQIVTSPAPP